MNIMRQKIILFSRFPSVFYFSQGIDNKAYIKANALLLPAGVMNVGAEYRLSKKYTLQGDILVSPWKSFAGKNAQVYMAGFGGRYYFSEAFRKWYVGANLSMAYFNMQKWNYWKGGITFSEENPELKYDLKNYYQEGFAMVFGADVGYQFKWRDNWNIDVFLGIGSSQGFYRGYDKISGDRIDELHYKEKRAYNRSGEIVPYRGGIMLSYRIK